MQADCSYLTNKMATPTWKQCPLNISHRIGVASHFQQTSELCYWTTHLISMARHIRIDEIRSIAHVSPESTCFNQPDRSALSIQNQLNRTMCTQAKGSGREITRTNQGPNSNKHRDADDQPGRYQNTRWLHAFGSINTILLFPPSHHTQRSSPLYWGSRHKAH